MFVTQKHITTKKTYSIIYSITVEIIVVYYGHTDTQRVLLSLYFLGRKRSQRQSVKISFGGLSLV